MPKESPVDARRKKQQQVTAATRDLLPGAPKAQSTKGTRAHEPKKVRHVCYLPPGLSAWVKAEAFRRSKPGAMFAETDLFEEGIRLLMKASDEE